MHNGWQHIVYNLSLNIDQQKCLLFITSRKFFPCQCFLSTTN